jgi:hypothetical protein
MQEVEEERRAAAAITTGSADKGEGSGSTRTRRSTAMSTIPRAAAIVMIQTTRTMRTHNL